jgi:hypothetical protein
LATRSDILQNKKKLQKVNKARRVNWGSRRPVEGTPGVAEGEKHDSTR